MTSYYPVISVTVQGVLTHARPPNLLFHDLKEVMPSDVTQGLVVVQYCVPLLRGENVRRLLTCLCLAADVTSISGELNFVVLQFGDGDLV
ncbi:hypothetical protein DSO57_1030860 [Entomophthora muscae]|uniref:Uncharacterized protein n=1 Tax=Entomophthora muscae TaxID=34485 RepID=A0ACC2TN76_9FUNG|nr:hypothetical protein DSO57_1030860 [Entomophthora muscae]